MSPPDDGDNNAATNDSNSANDSTANTRTSGIAQEEREALVAKRLQETLREREGFTPRGGGAQTAVPTGQATIAARLATVVMPRLAAPWPSPGAGEDGVEGWQSPGWVVSRAMERAVAQCGVDPWTPALDAAAVGTLLAKLWQG